MKQIREASVRRDHKVAAVILLVLTLNTKNKFHSYKHEKRSYKCMCLPAGLTTTFSAQAQSLHVLSTIKKPNFLTITNNNSI